MSDYIVETENLVKAFKSKAKTNVALNGINLKIKKGAIFSFLGPNGAGKTTTVRILSCVLKPSAGNAFVFGESVLDQDPVAIRQHIGVLTENHGLYERMTIEENLRFFGSFYPLGKGQLDENMNRLLQDFNLVDRKADKVGTLSKGLKQRAALVKTLIHDPELIFLDEPTSGLDPKAAVEFRDYINFLGDKTDKTVLICTTNLPEAQKLSDEVAIIDKGVIKRVGPPSELAKELFSKASYNIISTTTIPGSIESKLPAAKDAEIRIEGDVIKVFLDPVKKGS